ncbi:MAG: alpha/beta fold hydrolase [Planctomycetes bacterium]|nr:alpha/beta fold hydrolase [Planctomycetota bacterium]
MEPFFFGPTQHRLFGVYHPPKAAVERPVGVVLCHAFGQEYIRRHRALRQLAVILAGEGFHTLRFDLRGCGDSSGCRTEGTLADWVGDIGVAVEELFSGSGAERMCLIGVRLGASLALRFSAEQGDVDKLVLWDPIVEGKAYVEELAVQHAVWLRGSFARPQMDGQGRAMTERLGFPLSDALIAELTELDFRSVAQKPARHVLVVDSGPEPAAQPLVDALRARDCRVEHQHMPSLGDSIKATGGQGDVDENLVPVDVLQRMTTWLTEGES